MAIALGGLAVFFFHKNGLAIGLLQRPAPDALPSNRAYRRIRVRGYRTRKMIEQIKKLDIELAIVDKEYDVMIPHSYSEEWYAHQFAKHAGG